MSVRRSFLWLGSLLAVMAAVGGLGTLYLFTQRVRLDEENRRELAHVAHDLEKILGAVNQSAAKFFSEPHHLKDFAQQNPYIQVQDLEDQKALVCKPTEGHYCSGFSDPKTLLLLPQGGEAQSIPVNIAKVFDDVAIGETFEYLFIADGGPVGNGSADKAGEIVYAMGYGEANRHRQGLGWLDLHSREHDDRNHAVIGLQHIAALADSNGKPIDFKSLAGGSGTYPVRLGEDQYQLFSYAFALPFAEQMKQNPTAEVRSEHVWIVGGLVDPSRVWRRAADLSPRGSLYMCMMLLLVLFLQPFLKMQFLQPGERFRFLDACALVLNGVLLLMGFTVVLLEFRAHSQLNAQAASSLRKLADTVEQKLSFEFIQMRAALKSANDQFRDKPQAQSSSCPGVENFLKEPKNGFTVPSYKSFSQIFWVDSKGKQLYKLTTLPKPCVGVSQRPYFTEALRGDTWLWRLPKDTDEQRFFVQSLRSYTTAELETVLSIPSHMESSNNGSSASGPRVAAIASALVTVNRPFLPVGYNFAVIASDGQVLYHSDPRRTLKEDFFAEVEDPDEVHSAILANAETHFTTMYSGERTAVFIRPLFEPDRMHDIKPPDWFVVTMRETGWLDTTSTEALVHTLVWCLVAWLAPLLCTVIAFVTRRRVLAHCWPNPSKTAAYRGLAFSSVFLLAVGLIFTAKADPEGGALFWSSLLFPVIVGLTMVGVFCVSNASPRTIPPAPGFKRWYVLALAGIWAATSVQPAAGLFRHSWHLELDKLNALEQSRHERWVDDWSAADQEYYRKRDMQYEGIGNERINLRIDYAVNDTTGSQRALPAPDQWLDKLLPFYSEQVESIRHQHPKSCHSNLCADKGIASSGILLGGFGVVALLAAFWLPFTIETVFLTKLIGSSPKLLPRPAFDTRVTFVHATPAEKKKQLKAWLDRPAAAVAVASSDGRSSAQLEAARPEVIDLEEALGAESDDLERLETIWSGSGTAVILASSDDLNLLLDGQPTEVRERWMRVLPHSPEQCEFDALSRDEQLTLIQISQEGFANHRSMHIVERLIGKGLLKLDPELKLKDNAFQEFVKGRVSAAQVKQWERPQGFGWRNTRWVLWGLLGLAVLFAAVTGEAWVKSATGVMTAVAAGMEALWKVVTAAQRFASPAAK